MGTIGFSGDFAESLKCFVDNYKDYFSFTAALTMENKTLDEDISGNELSKTEQLKNLKENIINLCARCRLSEKRNNIVFGEGDRDCKLMFIGEAPGADEDRTGRPFVGRAGQLLTKIIESIGLKREDVYIANVIKCRPPENRKPLQDEVDTCSGFLRRQIQIIKPKIICTLGTVPMEFIIGKDKGTISRVRGKEFIYEGITVIPTYHPSYLLRNPAAKRDTWEDMKKIREMLSATGEA